MSIGGGSSHATRLAQISAANAQQQVADAQQQAAQTQQQAIAQAQDVQAQQLKSAQDAAQLAQTQQIAGIQRNVSVDTWNLLKQFGQRSALAGANLTMPLSSTTGGFATPPVTPGGGPARA